MTRKKVKLAFIVNDSKRKTTFRKRKNGLIKKASEINTLCGVDACVVIFNQNDPQPEVWPSESEAQRVLGRFKEVPELERSKRMLDQESFLKEKILKAQEQLKKQMDDNRKKEMTNILYKFIHAGQIVGDVSMADINDILLLIDENLKEVEQKINSMQAPQVVPNIGAETMFVREEQANIGGHVQGPETVQIDHDWSMDFTNNIDGELPFGDVEFPNFLWPNSQLP